LAAIQETKTVSWPRLRAAGHIAVHHMYVKGNFTAWPVSEITVAVSIPALWRLCSQTSDQGHSTRHEINFHGTGLKLVRKKLATPK